MADHDTAPGAPDPEDRTRDPEAQFAALAAELNLIRPGDKLDQNMLDFAHGVVSLCAALGDRYGDASDGNAGDHIRAVYGPV